MIQALTAFAKQLLVSGGFRVTGFPAKLYRELLTGLERMQSGEVVILSGLVELAKAHPGYLVVDDTKNPKYGLAHWAKKLKILTNGATRSGYEIILLLWLVPRLGRFPIGFALGSVANLRKIRPFLKFATEPVNAYSMDEHWNGDCRKVFLESFSWKHPP